MHDETSTGNDFFRCDFCLRGWREDLPMVEGHKGSLICMECLSAACQRVAVERNGVPHEQITGCTLCLQHREMPYWQRADYDHDAPGAAELAHAQLGPAAICEQCIVQCAGMMEKDPETNWVRPG